MAGATAAKQATEADLFVLVLVLHKKRCGFVESSCLKLSFVVSLSPRILKLESDDTRSQSHYSALSIFAVGFVAEVTKVHLMNLPIADRSESK